MEKGLPGPARHGNGPSLYSKMRDGIVKGNTHSDNRNKPYLTRMKCLLFPQRHQLLSNFSINTLPKKLTGHLTLKKKKILIVYSEFKLHMLQGKSPFSFNDRKCWGKHDSECLEILPLTDCLSLQVISLWLLTDIIRESN